MQTHELHSLVFLLHKNMKSCLVKKKEKRKKYVLFRNDLDKINGIVVNRCMRTNEIKKNEEK